MSRRTIRSALAQLVREKWLRRRGRGLTLAIRRPVRRRSRPHAATVICCIDDPFLDFHIPSVAQYHIDCVKSGRVAGALAVDGIRHGAGRSRHVKIAPEFVPGQTFWKKVS